MVNLEELDDFIKELSISACNVVWHTGWGLQLVKQEAPPCNQWVYFIRADELDRFRIGETTDLLSRSGSVERSVADVSVTPVLLLNYNLTNEDHIHSFFTEYNYKSDFFFRHEALDYFLNEVFSIFKPQYLTTIN